MRHLLPDHPKQLARKFLGCIWIAVLIFCILDSRSWVLGCVAGTELRIIWITVYFPTDRRANPVMVLSAVPAANRRCRCRVRTLLRPTSRL